MEMEGDEYVEDIGILGQDEAVMNFKSKQESRPSKEKVSAFKNRVFSLIMLFVEKAKDLAPIMPLLNEETFMKDPDRFREIINGLINRGSIPSEELMTIVHFYKKLLLFKGKRDTQKYTEDFIKILRKIKSDDENAMNKIVEEMLESFVLKRKCKLNVGFFINLIKKIPALRQIVVGKGTELKLNESVRPAQLRVLEKLLNILVKTKKVKQEHREEE